MIRFILALGGCALVGLANAQLPTGQPYAQNISFRHPAGPVARLVDALATQFQLPIDTSPSMSSEYLIVDVNGVEVGDLLDRIATVSSGRWSLSEGKYVLTRDAKAAGADERADRAYRKKVIEESIAKGLKQANEKDAVDSLVKRATEIARDLAKPSANDDAFRKMRSLEEARPGQRLALRLLSGIDAAEIATIRPGQRIVFSDSPNRMQKPLKNASVAIRTWMAERSIWAEARKVLEENPETKEWASVLELQSDPVESPARVLVAVSRGYEWFGLSYGVDVMLVGPQGGLTRVYSTFGSDPDPLNMVTGSGIERDDAVIEYSDTSKRLLTESRGLWSNDDGVTKKPGAEFFEIVTQPEKYEPLSFVPSDAVFAVRKKMGGQLVASLPDDLLITLMFAEQEQVPTVERFLRICEAFKLLSFTKEDGWLIGRPRLVTESRFARSDRGAVGEFVRLARKKEFLSLDEQSALSMRLSIPPMMGATGYSLLLGLGTRMDILNLGDWQFLSLYGHLNEDQRRSLVTGGRLPLGSLTKGQLAIVNDMVFGADHRLAMEDSAPANETKGAEEDEANEDTVAREPTEALPGGLPSEGYITASSSESLLFQTRMQNDDGQVTTNLENVDSVAWRTYARQRPELYSWAANLPRDETWRIGTTRDVNLTIRLSPRHFVRGTIRDNSIPADASWITPANAPASVKKKIDELVERYRKAGEGDDGTDGR